MSRAQGMLPHGLPPLPFPTHARPLAPSGAAGALPAQLGTDTTHLEEKPSLTFSSSTSCT